MSRTATSQLTRRQLAMLRAVAGGRAELTTSCEPDLYVDGLCCCDHAAAAELVRAGLVRAATPAGISGRAPAGLTDAGRLALARPLPAPAMGLAS